MSQSPDIDARRDRTASIWNLNDEIVLIGCGNPIGIPGGADQCYDFRSHYEYRWLTNETRPGSILAYDPREGWTRFTPSVTEAERVWDGVSDEPAGPYLDEFQSWIESRSGRKIAFLGAVTHEVRADTALTDLLRRGLLQVRRSKDEFELDRMSVAVETTKAGHDAARNFIRPGVTERQIQIEMEAAFFRAGADRPGYGSIVGTGPNSVVFHFTPSQRAVSSDDVVLIDAGAEVDGYVADVTRTYPADGKFSSRQQNIYDVLLDAQRKACDRCRVGVEWLDFHTLCALDLAAGLSQLGIFKVGGEQAVESEAFALFMPHGIGHMVGLGVRDASGAAPGRIGESKAAGVRVRCDLPLEKGFIMTVEPGIYFIPALLNDPARREKFANEIDWQVVDSYLDFGGMRIEDNVLVTDGDPVNLTIEIPV
jgi:Xaa-Pro aminopeptidase